MKPKYTLESVVVELVEGLQSGTIVLDREEPNELRPVPWGSNEVRPCGQDRRVLASMNKQ